MKTREIYKLFCKGIRLIVECTEEVNKNYELDPDPGMRGEVINAYIVDKGEVSEHVCIVVDFGVFEDFNKPLASCNYYDEDMIPRETWFEQSYYDDHKNNYDMYIEWDSEVFNIIENSLYEEFLESKSELSYIQWLEGEIVELKKYKLMLCSQNMNFNLKDGL